MEKTIKLQDNEEARVLFGRHDENLKRVESEFSVKVWTRQDELVISGDEKAVEFAHRLFGELLVVVRSGRLIRKHEMDYAIKAIHEGRVIDIHSIYLDRIEVSSKRHFVTPKTITQKAYVDAIRNYDIVFGIGPAGTGKCVAGSTLIFTNRGLIPIESIQSGTSPQGYTAIELAVSGINGIEKVSHIYNGGHSPTKRIRTKLGFEIEVTPEHPLLKLNSIGQKCWLPANELRIGDYVAIQRGQRLFGNQTSIEFNYSQNGPYDHSKSIMVDMLDEGFAYFLGILTGDGCLTSKNRVIISNADQEIVNAFTKMAHRLGLHVFRNGSGRPYDWIIASSQLYQLLFCLGMSDGRAHTKRVPRAILRAPEPLVVAFLQGLFDTDGTVSRRDGQAQLASVSKQLVDEVQLLLLNFGILANKRHKWIRYRNNKQLCYQIDITGKDADIFYKKIGFRLSRKQSLYFKHSRNTNIDVIPHIHQTIRHAVSAGTFSREVHHTLYDYEIGRRKPSYEALGKIVTLLEENAPVTDASASISELCEQHFFWAEVLEIKESEADVYDLTVPGSHSFCANGFVNHNTYLAMAMAVNALIKQEVSRIILTRPAVEAGESLGYLPGDLYEKITPYVRPLYDALYDMMEIDRIEKYIERGVIEVAPLAYMRGRTLNDAFIILDEAQNSTSEQMKMFLTRLGFDSKTVITGDITQVDLPGGKMSGLIQAQDILKDIEGIKIIRFSGEDVVRHELVQEIIKAYEQANNRQ